MWLLIILVTIVFLLLFNKKRLRWIYIALRTLPRDIRATITMVKIYQIAQKCTKDKVTIFKCFDKLATQHPQKVAFYFEDQIWTFADVGAYSNKIARHFNSEEYKYGDTVVLMLDNCPEFPCIIIGLSRLGIKAALINTNLRKNLLLYSITIIRPKAVIFGGNHWNAIEEITDGLKDIKLYHLQSDIGEKDNSVRGIDLSKELQEINDQPVEKLPDVSPSDSAIYIYTSGTTGLPKASLVTHARYAIMTLGACCVAGITFNDIIYTPLPFYHAGGGIAGIGQAIISGRTVAIGKKFSASSYFKDCVKYKATVGQHIGEMCRYILTAYADKEAEKHQVRVMYGNGLNPLVWKQFVEKFNIKNIIEFYGSTEGAGGLMNMNNKIGSVGYIPWFLQTLNWTMLVKCDEAGEPIRDSNGLCIKCGVNEPGLFIGKVVPDNAIFEYKGYTDKIATNKKIICNVNSKGDTYYNSGDILVYDEYGYYYFNDRTGDTFRWKGENVSTTEIEMTLSSLTNFSQVMVYGVQIPQTEGRAGMAAIVDHNKTIDFQSLGAALKLHLPNYSIPLFIRVLDAAPITSTFKVKKYELRQEGYNIDIIKDKLYFFDSAQNQYIAFNKQIYDDIVNNKLRL